MMKKLLILIIVLAAASSANAGLQISVNGNPDPVDSEIGVLPSGTLSFGIYATDGDTGLDWPGGFGYFALVSNESFGFTDGWSGVALDSPSIDVEILGPAVAYNGINNIPEGYDGPLCYFTSYVIPPPYPDGLYFDEILFHCEGAGDAQILLLEIDLYSGSWDGIIYDSVIVHQGIPEPATFLLLGLGGLTLLRNRKK